MSGLKTLTYYSIILLPPSIIGIVIIHYSLFQKHYEYITKLSFIEYHKHIEKGKEFQITSRNEHLRTQIPFFVVIILYTIFIILKVILDLKIYFSIVFFIAFFEMSNSLSIQIFNDYYNKRNLYFLREENKKLLLNEKKAWFIFGLIYLIIGISLNIYMWL